MAKTITKYTIFVSSPSDLAEERASIDEVIIELNLTYGKSNNCVFELLKWETHSGPGISSTYTQNIINEDIDDDYDIFLGLLWKRFGTPTGTASSGTEEEFNHAYGRFQENNSIPQILFYFKNSVPTKMSEIDPEQWLKVNQFKDSLPKDKMLFWEFESIQNLQAFLRLHIPLRIDSLKNRAQKNSYDLDKEEINNEDELGFFEYIELFSTKMAEANDSLLRISESTEWIGKEISIKTNEITSLTKIPNVNNSLYIPIFKKSAKILNDYSKKIELETPIFASTYEEGVKSGLNLLNIINDFSSENLIKELEESKESILELRKSIPDTLINLNGFRKSISDLPRVQSDFNKSKKNLLAKLDLLIEEITRSNELAIEFSNQLGNKIDNLKLY